jgi:hypothetical protein
MEKVTVDVDSVGLVFLNQIRSAPLLDEKTSNNYIRLDKQDCLNLISELAQAVAKL